MTDDLPSAGSTGDPALQASIASVDYVLVTDNATLNECCEYWREKALLALDTEFIRTTTFYPKVGLIQVRDGERNFLIDPLTIDDWSAFSLLMTAPEVCKVFHSCSEDLLVFIAFLGVIPAPLFDTQIAAAFLGMGLSISYQNLVQMTHGVELPKGETRSDWLQRPLSQEQLDYAALDVIYLPVIARDQMEQLRASDRLAWVEEDSLRSSRSYATEFSRDFSDYYQNIKIAWQLQDEKLLALKLLANWRENRARDRDKPRNWIIRDQELFNIAAAMPDSLSGLEQIEGLNSNFIRHEGGKVLDLIAEAASADAQDYPAPLARPLTTGQKNQFRRIKEVAQKLADQHGIPVELLARKKMLVELLQNIRAAQQSGTNWQEQLELPQELRGWRGEILLPGLLKEFETA